MFKPCSSFPTFCSNNTYFNALELKHPPWEDKGYRISQPIRRTVIFSLEILEKNNDECILILVTYWKKTGLLHTKISKHNILVIYSSQKPRKSSSLPLKSSSWLFSLSHDKDVV